MELEHRISTHEETLEEAVRYAARRMNAGTMGQLSGSGGETRTTNASELQGACKHSVAGALDAITSGILPGKWYTSRLCMIRMIAKLDLA